MSINEENTVTPTPYKKLTSLTVSEGTYFRIAYFFIGLWIVLLYFVFIAAVMFSLSVFQFKNQIEKISSQSVEDQEDVFIHHKCDITGIKGINNNEATIVELPCVREKTSKKSNRLEVSDVLIDGEVKTPYIDKAIAKINKDIDELERTQDKSEDPFVGEIMRGNLIALKSNLIELEESKIIAQKLGEKYKDLIHENNFYNTLFTKLIPLKNVENSWRIPQAFLSILLALSMGGLGSLITVTIEFIKIKEKKDGSKNLHASLFIFRPMLGTIVALAVYIALKSGQVSISEESENEISPFLLSFLGILSGMMSEYVYGRLIKQGEKIL